MRFSLLLLQAALWLPLLGLLLAILGERLLRDYRSPGNRIACGRGALLDVKVWLYVLCSAVRLWGTTWPGGALLLLPGGVSLAIWLWPSLEK